MADNGFVAYILELLEPLGCCTARAMFGGHGIYRDGAIFGLVFEDRLYLKTDEECRPAFIAAGGVPFEYAGKGRSVQTSYWSPPDNTLESPEELIRWGHLALAASARKMQQKARQKTSRRR